MNIQEIGNNINISPDILSIPEDKNKLPDLHFSSETLTSHTKSKVWFLLDKIANFQDISNQITSSLNELKANIQEGKEKVIDSTSSVIENVVDIYKDSPKLIGKVTDFLGKIPKNTYENMKLAVNNLQKSGELQTHIGNVAKALGIDPYVICGVCTQETKFDATAKSPVWASGLMQLMPNTEKGIRNFIERGNKVNAWPEEKFYASLRDNKPFMEIYKNADLNTQNLAIGSAFLWWLNKKFWGNQEAILSYYNGGGSSTAKNSSENKNYAPWALSYAKLFREMNIFPTT